MTSGTSAEYLPRRAGAEVDASIRVHVATTGLYRVTQPQLTAIGVDSASIVGSSIRMFTRTNELSIWVSNPGGWTTNDYLVFYGQGISCVYACSNAYWIGFGGTGRRMATVDASTNLGGRVVNTHCDVARYAKDSLFREGYRPQDDTLDHWFAGLLSSAYVTNYSVLTDNPDTTKNASLVLKLDGYFSASHSPKATIKGTTVAQFSYSGGETSNVSTHLFAGTLLSNGMTVVSLTESTAGQYDFLREFEVHYTRFLRGRSGSVLFGTEGGTNILQVSQLSGTAGQAWMLDVTDPVNPVILAGTTQSGSAGAVTVSARSVSSGIRSFFACGGASLQTVPTVSKFFFRGLAATNQACEYIGIVPASEFRPSAYRLLKHRNLDGTQMDVIAATMDDVYNEFSYGIVHAYANKQFLGYAFHRWQAPPKYACLIGDGHYDPKNNLGNSPACLIPVKLGASLAGRSQAQGGLYTSLDSWFACVNGSDPIADIALGRIPIESEQQLSNFVAKIVAYEAQARPTTATVVADNPETNVDPLKNHPFNTDATTYIVTPLQAQGYSVSNVYLTSTSSAAAAVVRAGISNSVNKGTGRHFLSFVGHGSYYDWCAERVWTTNDVALMTNGVLPIVTVFTCWNGYFHRPEYSLDSLSETFVQRAKFGSVASVAPSALSWDQGARMIAQGFFNGMSNSTARLGDLLLSGFQNLYLFNPVMKWDEYMTYGVAGDPATKVR
jgi:hypothetical protein